MDSWDQQGNAIFARAAEIESVAEREAYLAEACRENKALRGAVDSLLASHQQAGSFLDGRATGSDQTIDMDTRALEAGLAASFTVDTALIIGDAGHSVLQSLGKTLARVPRVTLRDENGDQRQSGSDTPTETGSRYQLGGEIARGGMGAIFKGRDVDLGRDLAIKVLLNTHKDNPDAVARFVEEAQIGGQLQHPGIVPVHELGQFSDDRPYFSMKLVKGETLASLLSDRGDPSESRPKFLGIFEQICQTIAYAHSRDVIHRDLKPANIMVGAFGEVQVMDWGLAKVLGDHSAGEQEQRPADAMIQTHRSGDSASINTSASQTRMGSVMGTPAYMPPEQALGEIDRLDERADVFGLGAILCEILTGQPPYVGEDGTEVYRKATRGDLEDCFARLDACHSEHELIEFAKKSLTAEPKGRLRNAGEMAAGMTEYLLGVQERLKQAELGRVEAQARAEEERRRRKLHLALAGVMLLLAVGTAFAAMRFRRQREVAENRTRVATAMRLAVQAQANREKLPLQSLLLAIEAAESTLRHDGTVLPVAHETLLSTTHNVGGLPLIGHEGRIRVALISPDGRKVVTTSDGRVGIWDLTTDDLAANWIDLEGLKGSHAAAISPDSRWLAIGGDGKNPLVWLWDITADKPAFVLEGHKDEIQSLAISPDGHWLASGSDDKTARLWDLNNPTDSSRELLHDDSVLSVAIGPHSRWLATGSYDGTARLWDLTADNPEASSLVLKGHKDRIESVAISPDGRWLATGSSDETARLWDVIAQDPEGLVLKGHKDEVWSVTISPDGRWLATGSRDETARLWDLTTENPAASSLVLRGHEGAIMSVAISPDSRWLVTGSHDFTARLWDLHDEDPAASPLVLRAHEDSVQSLAIGPNSSCLVTGSWDGTARLWDLASENPASSLVLRSHDGEITRLATSPDGRWLVTASVDSTAQLWDFATTGQEPVTLSRVLRGHEDRISSIAVSRNSRRLVTGSWDGTARLWDLTDAFASPRVFPGSGGKLLSASISPDEHWLVTADQGSTAQLWNLTDPAASPQELSGYEANSSTVRVTGRA